jgi:hypothetical protein
MADHGKTSYATAEGNDYPAHEDTYENFLGLVKWGTIVVIGIVVALAVFVA